MPPTHSHNHLHGYGGDSHAEAGTPVEEVAGMDKRSCRLAGVSGILFVVLTYTSVILGDTGILGA